MADYIPREAAGKRFHKLILNFYSAYEKDGKDERLAALLEIVLAARSALNAIPAADVIEVVRCKDCRYSYEEPYPMGISHRVCAYGVCVDCEVEDYFYCACGAKMDGDGE